MVNIAEAARAAVAGYGAAIALGGNYSIPITEVALQVSSYFLPNYTQFTLGTIGISPNQSIIAESLIAEYTSQRKSGGPGTNIKLQDSRVEVASDQSAICWLKFHIKPQDCVTKPWDWTIIYGFRLVEGGMDNGLDGGWEFGNGDDEQEQFAKRFPGATV